MTIILLSIKFYSFIVFFTGFCILIDINMFIAVNHFSTVNFI